MDMEVCGRCKAFVQPTWDHCLICGAGASDAEAHGSAPTGRPAGHDRRPPERSGSIAVVIALVAVLLVVLGVGGWYVLDQTSDDDTRATAGPVDGDDAANADAVPPAPADPADVAAHVDTFTTLTLAGFSSEGIEVDRACAHAVASRPEHASVIGQAMEGATSGDLGDTAMQALVQPISVAVINECVGLANIMAQVMTQEYGLSPASAACVGAAFESDPELSAAFETLGDYEPSPQVIAAMVACMTPEEIQAMAQSD